MPKRAVPPSRADSDILEFTPRVKNVFRIAAEEAKKLKVNAIGTDILLLAIAQESSGIGCAILETLKIDAGKIRDVMMHIMEYPRRKSTTGPVVKSGYIRGRLFLVDKTYKVGKPAKGRRRSGKSPKRKENDEALR